MLHILYIFCKYLNVFSDAPSRPVGPLSVNNITKSSAVISWKLSENDGGSPIISYITEKKETWKSSWAMGERVPANTTSCELTFLSEDCEYHARVFAENSAGLSEPLMTTEPFLVRSPYGKFLLINSLNQAMPA